MKHKKLLLAVGAFAASFFAFLAITNTAAFAATKTWDGGGSDNNFNTGANWSGDTAPSNGDDLVFDTDFSSTYSDFELTNDLSSASFASITFQGAGSNSFTIDGNAFTLTGDLTDSTSSTYNYPTISAAVTLSGNKTITVPDQHGLTLSGNLAGSGNIAKAGAGFLSLSGDNSSYTGTVTASAGSIAANYKGAAGSGGLVSNDGSDVTLYACDKNGDSQTPVANLTLTGASSDTTGQYPKAKLLVVRCDGAGGGGVAYGYPTFGNDTELTGSITLGSDVTLLSYVPTLTIKSSLSGSHKFNIFAGSASKLVVQSASNNSGMANGEYSSPVLTKEITDDAGDTSIAVYGNTIVILNGRRNFVNVAKGATLKGTGTAGSINVLSGGTIAPGLSPGTINSGDLLFEEGGTYQFEIGKDAADQIKVTGTVTLGNATLDIQHFEKYVPPVNKQYVLIDNDGTDAVTGTFKDLAEGATFSRNGYTYQIGYKGGDGNDVVLTIKNVPASPDTGFGILTQNPLATLATTTAAAGAIYMAAKRYRPVATRR